MKKVILLSLLSVLCSALFAQTTDTLAGFYSNGKVGRKVVQNVYTLPYLPKYVFNGYGVFYQLNSDSIVQGSTNLFTTSTQQTNWNTAYNKYIVSGSYSAGTLTLTRNDASTLAISGFSTGGGGGTPGGSDTHVQFNDAGAFGGDAAFVWNNTNKRLGLGGASSGALLDVKGVTWLDSIAISRGAKNIFDFGNIGIGDSVLRQNTTGVSNTGVGDSVLRVNTTGSRNTAVGNGAMSGNSTGNDNTAVGTAALGVTTGTNNTAVGRSALSNVSTQSNNTAVGYTAGTNVTGASNTLIGSVANASSGSNNTIIGASSGSASMTGSDNTVVGQSARGATTGGKNSAFGVFSLTSATSGTFNSAFGYSTLGGLTAGGYNTIMGGEAARFYGGLFTTTSLSTLDSSLIAGYHSSPGANADKNEVVLAGYNGTGLGSNSTSLGNTGTTKTAIGGRTAINANVNNTPSSLAYSSAMSEPVAGAVADFMGIGAVKLPELTSAQRDALSLGAPLASVTIATAGSGQTTGSYALTFTGGGGSGAAGFATVAGGVLTTVTISSWGNGYTSAPTVTMASAGGTSATFTATVRSVKGLTIFCTDCTATDASTGVIQTYNGSTWKSAW